MPSRAILGYPLSATTMADNTSSTSTTVELLSAVLADTQHFPAAPELATYFGFRPSTERQIHGRSFHSTSSPFKTGTTTLLYSGLQPNPYLSWSNSGRNPARSPHRTASLGASVNSIVRGLLAVRNSWSRSRIRIMAWRLSFPCGSNSVDPQRKQWSRSPLRLLLIRADGVDPQQWILRFCPKASFEASALQSDIKDTPTQQVNGTCIHIHSGIVINVRVSSRR